MKHIFTIIGIAGILIVAMTVKNVAAQSMQPLATQPSATAVATIPAAPQAQSSPVTPPQTGWGMGMHGRMMGGRMGMHGGMAGSMQMNAGPMTMHGQMGITAGDGYGMNHETMMTGLAPMHDDVARMLGMTTQDLYNHMASGKSMAQIAAERGITEQQLMDSIMAGRRAAYNQAVMGGYMTQAQADAMLQNMSSNLKNMVNGQGYGSNGWGMMWGTPTTPQTAP